MSALSSGKDPFKDTLHELLHVVLLLKIKVLHVHVQQISLIYSRVWKLRFSDRYLKVASEDYSVIEVQGQSNSGKLKFYCETCMHRTTKEDICGPI